MTNSDGNLWIRIADLLAESDLDGKNLIVTEVALNDLRRTAVGGDSELKDVLDAYTTGKLALVLKELAPKIADLFKGKNSFASDAHELAKLIYEALKK